MRETWGWAACCALVCARVSVCVCECVCARVSVCLYAYVCACARTLVRSSVRPSGYVGENDGNANRPS